MGQNLSLEAQVTSGLGILSVHTKSDPLVNNVRRYFAGVLVKTEDQDDNNVNFVFGYCCKEMSHDQS